MNFWKKSLVLRLAGSFFLLSLLLVNLMGWSSYLLARYRMTQAVYTQLNLAAELKRQTFHEWVEAQQNVLRLAARLPGFEAAAERLVQSAAGDASLEAASEEDDFKEAYEALRFASQISWKKKGLPKFSDQRLEPNHLLRSRITRTSSLRNLLPKGIVGACDTNRPFPANPAARHHPCRAFACGKRKDHRRAGSQPEPGKNGRHPPEQTGHGRGHPGLPGQREQPAHLSAGN
jgi:hypothetical protein